MSDTEEPKPARSVFDGPAEPPAEDAIRVDEGRPDGEHIDEEGHLTKRVEAGDTDPFDHGEEHKAVREKQKADGTAPPDMPSPAPSPLNNPAVMENSTDALEDEMQRRFSAEYGEMKVEVDQQERDAFVRSSLHDEELVFDIELEGVGTTVTVAIPPDNFTNMAAAAVSRWGKDDFIDSGSDMQWLLTFQQLHAWYQVRAVDGEPTPWSDFWADGMPKMSAIREKLDDKETFEDFFNMNAARWQMLLQAVRIAELKYKICLENWKDRSFFAGADTA